MQSQKVAWLEGMLICPQHFQQQEAYFDYTLHDKLSMLNPYLSGFYEFSLDLEALHQNKICLLKAHGVFPDGTWFKYDHAYDDELVLEIADDSNAKTIYLCIAMVLNASNTTPDEKSSPRYQLQLSNVKDHLSRDGTTQEITMAELNLHLATNNDDLTHYYYLPIAQIDAILENQGILLADSFIPPCINLFASYRFEQLFNNTRNMLEHKQRTLCSNLEGSSPNELSISSVDGAMLQIINRAVMMMSHWQTQKQIHPINFYEFLLTLLAELSTYMSRTRRLEDLIAYHHLKPADSFIPMFKALSELLHTQLDQQAIEIALHLKDNDLYKAMLSDNQFTRQGRYILMVKVGLPVAQIERELLHQVKIAALTSIEKIINLQLPGIPLKLLPRAPAMIVHDENASYFELETDHEYWQSILKNHELCIYITRDYPKMSLKLWFLPTAFSSPAATEHCETSEKEETISG